MNGRVDGHSKMLGDMVETLTPERPARYADVWRVRPFRVVFTSRSLAITADTLRTVALSILVYTLTQSPTLAAITYGISFMPQVIGSSLFGALPDRVRPRVLITAGYGLECVTGTVIALAHVPVWVSLVIVALVACLTPVFSGAASRVVADVLTGDAYVVGRSLSNLASSAAQLLGLAGGGVATAALGPRHALLVSAVCHLIAAAGVRLCLADIAIPTEAATPERRSTVRDSWSGNVALVRIPLIRLLLLAQWLPAAFVTGAESLIVPYARVRDFPDGAAGWLLAAMPFGMILGNLVTGRLVTPGNRERVVGPLIAILGAPLVAVFINPPGYVTGVLFAISGCGFAYGLGVQRRFREVAPAARRGQAFGLLATGLMTAQGVCPALCGLLAEAVPIANVIALMGALSVLTAFVVWVRRHDIAPRRD
jgi:predicted MFS family arabinose efflux permease